MIKYLVDWDIFHFVQLLLCLFTDGYLKSNFIQFCFIHISFMVIAIIITEDF